MLTERNTTITNLILHGYKIVGIAKMLNISSPRARAILHAQCQKANKARYEELKLGFRTPPSLGLLRVYREDFGYKPIKCKHCKDTLTIGYCEECQQILSYICKECHNEVVHNKIRVALSKNTPIVGDLKSSPYHEEDAQYYPGICDKWQSYDDYFHK